MCKTTSGPFEKIALFQLNSTSLFPWRHCLVYCWPLASLVWNYNFPKIDLNNRSMIHTFLSHWQYWESSLCSSKFSSQILKWIHNWKILTKFIVPKKELDQSYFFQLAYVDVSYYFFPVFWILSPGILNIEPTLWFV